MNEAMSGRRRAYDHRLRELACEDGSAHLLGGIGVPRSTAASWRRRGPRAVVTLDVVTKDTIELQAEVIRLRQRNEVLSAIARLLFMLLRLAGVRLDETRIPEGAAKAKILAAIARARTTLQLAVVLRVLGLSPSRYHAWNRLERACQLDDAAAARERRRRSSRPRKSAPCTTLRPAAAIATCRSAVSRSTPSASGCSSPPPQPGVDSFENGGGSRRNSTLPSRRDRQLLPPHPRVEAR
jgi:hypothetical protein